MAKKRDAVRRVPRSSTPKMYGDGKPSQAAQSTTSGVTGRAPAAPGRSSGVMASRPAVPLAQEYRYVLGDLRRLGILAAGVFAVLIVMGLLIR